MHPSPDSSFCLLFLRFSRDRAMRLHPFTCLFSSSLCSLPFALFFLRKFFHRSSKATVFCPLFRRLLLCFFSLESSLVVCFLDLSFLSPLLHAQRLLPPLSINGNCTRSKVPQTFSSSCWTIPPPPYKQRRPAYPFFYPLTSFPGSLRICFCPDHPRWSAFDTFASFIDDSLSLPLQRSLRSFLLNITIVFSFSLPPCGQMLSLLFFVFVEREPGLQICPIGSNDF